VAGAGGTAAIRVYFLEISVKSAQVCAKFNEIGGFSYFYVYFRTGVLGAPVWEPGPKILGGPAGAPKMTHPAPC
jgi:hypothetical protein